MSVALGTAARPHVTAARLAEIPDPRRVPWVVPPSATLPSGRAARLYRQALVADVQRGALDAARSLRQLGAALGCLAAHALSHPLHTNPEEDTHDRRRAPVPPW